MAQFRLTTRLAKDFKVATLYDPHFTQDVLDDWYLDLVRIDRRKFMLCMHRKSLLAFMLPYSYLDTFTGRTQSEKLCSGFQKCLEDIFAVLNFHTAVDGLRDEAPSLFSWGNFTKTQDRSTLRYACDFAFHFERFYYQYDKNTDQAIQASLLYWLDHFIKPNGTTDYTTPRELLNQLLNANTPRADNIIYVDFRKTV